MFAYFAFYINSSNKSIIISPKSSKISSKIKSILPIAIIIGIGAFLINFYSKTTQIAKETFDFAEQRVMAEAATKAPDILTQSAPTWQWFLAV